MARQAKYLSEMVNSDPQMQIPPYPRLSEDYLKLWYNSDMLIVEGGLSEVVLRGRSVRSLLPQLLPLLDGCRTIAEITACVRGFKDKAIHDALTLLYMQGLLEDGRAGRDKMSTSQLTAYGSALKFYSRYIDFTRASKGRYDLLHALQSKHVLLSATGSATLPFVSALAELGIGEITVIANDVLANTLTALSFPCTTLHVLNRSDDDVGPEKIADHLAAAERPYDLLLLLTDRPSPLWLRALNQAAIAFESFGRDLHAAATDRAVEFRQRRPQVVALQPCAYLVLDAGSCRQQIESLLCKLVENDDRRHGSTIE